MAQMEKELLKKFMSVAKRTPILECINNLDRLEIQEILHDVLSEISYTKKKLHKS